MESRIPFVQSLAAEVGSIDPEDDRQPGDFVQLHAPLTTFPVAHGFLCDMQCGGNIRLLEP